MRPLGRLFTLGTYGQKDSEEHVGLRTLSGVVVVVPNAGRIAVLPQISTASCDSESYITAFTYRVRVVKVHPRCLLGVILPVMLANHKPSKASWQPVVALDEYRLHQR